MISRDLEQNSNSLTRPTPSASPKRTHRELSEPEAIRKAQRGDASAFELLYNRYSGRVHAICLRIVCDPAEAEDLTQEAFLLVFRKIHTFRGASAFSTWLHRVALNVAYMHIRKKRSQPGPFEELSKPANEGHPKEFGGPDLRLERFVDRVSLERALATLNGACKTVFVLHDVQGFKHSEIAVIMECSVESSKGQLHRARARLRHLLRGGLGGLPLTFSSLADGPMDASAF